MSAPVRGGEQDGGIRTPGDLPELSLIPVSPAGDEEAIFDDPVVPLTEVWNPAEAEIVCSLLQAHGIPCILKAENQYAVEATYTIGPLARRRILVRESDLRRAQEILRAVPVPDPQTERPGEGPAASLPDAER